MATLIVIWANGDTTKIRLTDEAVRAFKEKRPHHEHWSSWTISSSNGGWNLQHAREVCLEE